MVEVDLLLKAAEWGAKMLNAADTKAQKRAAATVEKCAVLVAGLQHMDHRFTQLFVPLVFYDPGSWPIEKRRAWAEDALGFIHGDRVVDRLGQAITYLEATPVDDPLLASLVQELCDITHVALWGATDADVDSPLVDVDYPFQPDGMGWTWADNLHYGNRGFGSMHVRAESVEPTYVSISRHPQRPGIDIDADVAPVVARLVALVRTNDPDPGEVVRAASDCLLGPEDLRSRIWPPLQDYRRLLRDDIETLDSYRSGQTGDDWDDEDTYDPRRAPGAPNTVSPLRDFADNAGRLFQQILSAVRAAFPGLPEPSWLWEN